MNALNEMFWASLKDSFRSEHTLPNFKSEMNDIKFPDSDPSAANNYSWFFIFPFLNFSFLFWGWRSTHCFGSHLWAEWRKRDCILHPFKRYKKTFILETSILFGTLSQSTIVTYCQCIFYVSIAERCYVKVIKFINITLFTAFHQRSPCLSCGIILHIFFFFKYIFVSCLPSTLEPIMKHGCFLLPVPKPCT